MRDGGAIWILLLLGALIIAILVARSNSSRANRESAAAKKVSADRAALAEEFSQFQKQHVKEVTQKNFMIEGLSKIIEQRKTQFPWLASAFADLHSLDGERAARYLESKKHPAKKAAEDVREHARKRRETEREFRILRYRVEYYEKLFPWIEEYVGDDVPDSVVDVSGAEQPADDDPAVNWLTRAEYEKLPTAVKYQKALDNWSKRKKTRWEVGRDYERYVGYLYETMGYDVEFTGAIEGYEDMGRDIIARRGSEMIVIQCKYWASHKEIREKHIFQLFGSTLEYAFRFGDLGDGAQDSLFTNPVQAIGIKPVLYTSTQLSSVAKDAAKRLGVQHYEMAKISEYPLVKCNVSTRDGEKIYHLPFDQQYDRVKICKQSEKYAYTVAEAEGAGFRRAWRWRPEAAS